MVDQKLKMLVNGAGLVGSLLAFALKKQGHEVTLVEKRSDMRKTQNDVGRSINLIITSRGLNAVKEVGLLKDVLALTAPVTGRMMHSREGELTYQPYGKDPSECNFSISRAELNKLLMTKAEELGVQIIFDNEFSKVDFDKNEAYYLGASKIERTISFDHIFGTDGAASPTRKELLRHVGELGQESMNLINSDYKEMMMPAKSDGSYQIDKNALHIWPRGKHMLMALPNQDGSFTMTLYLPRKGAGKTFETIKNEATVTKLFEEDFKDAFELMPNFKKDFINNPQGVLGTVRARPWYFEDKMVLLGDAAHAVVPFYGQGMNCGFEDIHYLFTLINKYGVQWEKIFQEYGDNQKINGDAIADLAEENFYVMSEKVADQSFLFMKEVENELQKKFPSKFRSQYGMVVYTLVPYAYAQLAGKLQQEILEELSFGINSLNSIDWKKAELLINNKLVPLQNKWNASLERYKY